MALAMHEKPDFLSVVSGEGWEEGGRTLYANHGRRPSDWDRRMAAFIDLTENKAGFSYHKWASVIEEAAVTGDFPLLFGDTIDRDLLTRYNDTAPVMVALTRQRRLSDLRQAKTFRMDGADGVLPEVAEQATYTDDGVVENEFLIQLIKHGRIIPISLETIINDDLNAFGDLGDRLGTAARRTQEFRTTGMFFDANGPNTTIVGNGAAPFVGGQPAISVLPLTIDNLATAIQEKLQYTDADTDAPIRDTTPMFLVVGPGQQVNAMDILNSLTVQFSGNAAGTETKRATSNSIRDFNLQLVIARWIPQIVTTGTVANTCWMLVSDPNEIAAVQTGVLRSKPTPQLFMKSPNATAVGGGPVKPFEGDFETDSIAWKMRMWFGTGFLDPLAVWGSKGQA